MFDGIVMNVVQMVVEVALVANDVVVEAAMP